MSEGRRIGRRVSFGIVWAIVFYVLTTAIVGGVVGFFAGLGTTSFEAGAMAGQHASAEFFADNRWIILGVQVSIFAILCFYGLLPGVGKGVTRRAPILEEPPPPSAYSLSPELPDNKKEGR